MKDAEEKQSDDDRECVSREPSFEKKKDLGLKANIQFIQMKSKQTSA